MTAPKKGRQKKIKLRGQPAPRWRDFMQAAAERLRKRGGYLTTGHGRYKDGLSAIEILATEIAAHGDGAAFLMAARRGRPTQRQDLRYQLLREVEQQIGAAHPRRREDANTPDALALRTPVELELK